jgi:hypothetical protein
MLRATDTSCALRDPRARQPSSTSTAGRSRRQGTAAWMLTMDVTCARHTSGVGKLSHRRDRHNVRSHPLPASLRPHLQSWHMVRSLQQTLAGSMLPSQRLSLDRVWAVFTFADAGRATTGRPGTQVVQYTSAPGTHLPLKTRSAWYMFISGSSA